MPISSNPTVLTSCLSEAVNLTSMSPTLTQIEKPISHWNLTKSKPMKSMNSEESILTLLHTLLSSKARNRPGSRKELKYQNNMPSNSKSTSKSPDSLYKKLSKVSKTKEPWSPQSDKESHLYKKEDPQLKR